MLIANAFFRSGDIECWGRGYKRIMEAINEYKLLPPQIEVINGLNITYYTDVRSQLSAQKMDERYSAVIEFAVKNGRVTNSDVQKILGISKPSASRFLCHMKDWLEKQGNVGKGTYYIPKWLTYGSHMAHQN
ncbi:MAG: transcriptional regulator, partial [Prevotella sp.]|nr:transcriptional regulator [Prevotella sp.]